jgi:hypothetical protein
VHYHYYFVTTIDSMVGWVGANDHFSIDGCSIVILERPRELGPQDEIGTGNPSC